MRICATVTRPMSHARLHQTICMCKITSADYNSMIMKQVEVEPLFLPVNDGEIHGQKFPPSKSSTATTSPS